MSVKIRVRKRRAIYIPKKLAKKLNINEGDLLLMDIKGDKIELRKIHDPIELALSREKFARITHDELEEVSLIEQRKRIEGSS